MAHELSRFPKSLRWMTEQKMLKQFNMFSVCSFAQFFGSAHAVTVYLYDCRIWGQAVVRSWSFTQCDVLNITSPESDVLIDVVFGWRWSIGGSSLRSKTLDWMSQCSR